MSEKLEIKAKRFEPGLEGFFIDLMEKHGITVVVDADEYVLNLSFPEHTTRQAYGIYRVRDTQYIIKLPDDFILHETVPYDGKRPSSISFQLKDVPQEIQNAHPKGVNLR